MVSIYVSIVVVVALADNVVVVIVVIDVVGPKSPRVHTRLA